VHPTAGRGVDTVLGRACFVKVNALSKTPMPLPTSFHSFHFHLHPIATAIAIKTP
jgi:hypothetical protein